MSGLSTDARLAILNTRGGIIIDTYRNEAELAWAAMNLYVAHAKDEAAAVELLREALATIESGLVGEGGVVEDHCPECNEFESECVCGEEEHHPGACT